MSLFFHVAVAITLIVFPVDTEALKVDLFDSPDRFAQLVLTGPTSPSLRKTSWSA